jgi:hypothetical protein
MPPAASCVSHSTNGNRCSPIASAAGYAFAESGSDMRCMRCRLHRAEVIPFWEDRPVPTSKTGFVTLALAASLTLRTRVEIT